MGGSPNPHNAPIVKDDGVTITITFPNGVVRTFDSLTGKEQHQPKPK